MTLGDLKDNVLRLIEEYSEKAQGHTDDVDIRNKINVVVNSIMFEICELKKIVNKNSISVEKDEIIDLSDKLDNYRQLIKIIGVKFDILKKFVTFLEKGTANIFYYKNPTPITSNTDDSYIFELSDELFPIMENGIAAKLLENDVSANYGQVYLNKYKEALQLLDPREDTGIIEIEGGIDEFE